MDGTKAKKPEPELIVATLRGDAEAFGALVLEFQQTVFRQAYLLLRDAEAAEDVAQEAFLRARRNLHRFRLGEPLRPWLLRITSNLARNELRARGRRVGLLDRVRGIRTEHSQSPHRDVERGEHRDRLWDAIGSLSHDDQVVLYLRHYLELPEAEIATAINKKPGTVKSRLSRAGTRLRSVIEERFSDLVPEGEGRRFHG